jgi:rubredoxin
VRQNQASIGVEEKEFVCISCAERQFDTKEALIQHCRNVRGHKGEWCERCKWLFISAEGRKQHVRDSPNHWVCSKCGIDELEEESLRSHLETKHSFCCDCHSAFLDQGEHRVQLHNRCPICHEEFENENEVLMVSRNINISPRKPS